MTEQSLLPQYTTPFIGRETESKEVAALLIDPQHRLVTLIGPSGAGKTRLCLQVVQTIGADFPDGCVWVDLTPISDPELVLPTIAYTLDIREVANQPLLEALITRIGERRLLLVLDNVEQIITAVGDLEQLVQRTPHLTLLVTSQEALVLPSEHVYTIPPLEVPETTQSPEELLEYPAIALFVERMRATQPDFELTSTNAAAVMDICNRVHGLPLAIELIAAHSHQMSPNDLLLLVRNYLPRKERPKMLLRRDILRPVLDWCHRSLPPLAQTAFARLSVFTGGWTFEAAQAIVVNRNDSEFDTTLGLLVSKHLVQSETQPDGTLRYSMLDSVREYAQNRLSQRPEVGSLTEQHARWFLQLSSPGTEGIAALLEKLTPEHHNLRAALRWFITKNKINESAELAGNLGMYWYYRGHWIEGMLLLRGVEPLLSAAPPQLQAVVYKWLASLSLVHGDPASAVTLMKRSLRFYEEAGDKLGVLSTHNNLGVIARDRGDYLTAEAHLREALDGAEALEDTSRAFGIANNLGLVIKSQGRVEEAIQLHERYLPMAREAGDSVMVAFAVLNLGTALHDIRNFDQAEPLMREAIELYQQIGSKHFLADALAVLAHIELLKKNKSAAKEHALESLRMREEINDYRGLIVSLEYGASFAVADGNLRGANQLLGAAEAIREQIQFIRSPYYQPFLDEWLVMISTKLTPEEITESRAQGMAMGRQEALALLRTHLT